MITYIFGASHIDNYDYLEKLDFSDSFIICADGGIKHLQKLGLTPDVIIGDFDSSKEPDNFKNKIVYPAEKDDTDLGLAIMYAAKHELKECIAIGCLGGRIDHTYANFSLIKFALDKGVKLELIDEKSIVFAVSESCEVLKSDYKYISIFPFGESASGISLDGFKYPLVNAQLKYEFPLGVSNQLACEVGKISVTSGVLLVMMVKE